MKRYRVMQSIHLHSVNDETYYRVMKTNSSELYRKRNSTSGEK